MVAFIDEVAFVLLLAFVAEPDNLYLNSLRLNSAIAPGILLTHNFLHHLHPNSHHQDLQLADYTLLETLSRF